MLRLRTWLKGDCKKATFPRCVISRLGDISNYIVNLCINTGAYGSAKLKPGCLSFIMRWQSIIALLDVLQTSWASTAAVRGGHTIVMIYNRIPRHFVTDGAVGARRGHIRGLVRDIRSMAFVLWVGDAFASRSRSDGPHGNQSLERTETRAQGYITPQRSQRWQAGTHHGKAKLRHGPIKQRSSVIYQSRSARNSNHQDGYVFLQE